MRGSVRKMKQKMGWQVPGLLVEMGQSWIRAPLGQVYLGLLPSHWLDTEKPR